MAGMPGIVIRVAADTRDAIRDLGRVDKALGNTATSSQKANAIIGRGAKIAAGALAGAAVAAGALAVKLGADGVEAAIDDQAAQKKLAQALKNNGFAAYTDQVEAAIDAMMQATGIADDELRPAYAQLLGVTKDLALTEQLMAAAMDLSAAKSVPLETAVKALAKSAAGSSTALSRIAPELGKIDTKGDAAAATLAAVNKQFGGQQAARMETIAGQTAAVSTAFDELKESFGQGLIGNIDGTTSSLGGLSKMLYDNQDTAQDFGASLHSIAEGLLAIASAYGKAKDALDALPGADLIAGGAGSLINGPLGWLAAQNPISANAAREQAALAARRASAGGASTDIPDRFFDPVQYMANARVATARADGRSAQRDARTGGRP